MVHHHAALVGHHSAATGLLLGPAFLRGDGVGKEVKGVPGPDLQVSPVVVQLHVHGAVRRRGPVRRYHLCIPVVPRGLCRVAHRVNLGLEGRGGRQALPGSHVWLALRAALRQELRQQVSGRGRRVPWLSNTTRVVNISRNSVQPRLLRPPCVKLTASTARPPCSRRVAKRSSGTFLAATTLWVVTGVASFPSCSLRHLQLLAYHVKGSRVVAA